MDLPLATARRATEFIARALRCRSLLGRCVSSVRGRVPTEPAQPPYRKEVLEWGGGPAAAKRGRRGGQSASLGAEVACRQGARHGAVRAREDISAEELQAPAPSDRVGSRPGIRVYVAPKSGTPVPESGPRFGTGIRSQKRYRIPVSKSVPLLFF